MFHSLMEGKILFILLFVFSSVAESIMAHETEDNKTVAITVNYKEERGTIKVNNVEVKNGQSLSVEYGSTVSITITPNDGYCASLSNLQMTPKRGINQVIPTDLSYSNTKPMTLVFNDFVEDMIFDYTFRKLLKVDIEILDDDEINVTEVNNYVLYAEKRNLLFSDMEKINIKFSDKNGSYLKQVLIDNVDRTSEVRDNNLQLIDFPKNIVIEYGRKDGYYMIKYKNEGTGFIQVNENTPGLVPASSQAVITFYPTNKDLKKCLQNGVDVLAKIKDRKLILPSVSEDILFQIDFGTPLSCYLSYNNGGEVKVNGIPIANDSSIPVSTGTDVQVSMFPQAGYHIKQVQLGNDDVTGQLSNNILTISSISTNKNIKVIFEEDTPATHSVKVTYSPGGSVKVNDKSVTSGQSTTATASTDVKVEIIPQAGYLIKQVRLGNDDVTGQLIHNILTIPSILSDKEISITFEKGASITYAVKVTYSTGGSVMVNDQLVTSGQSVTATASTDVKVMIMPQDGYHIRQVKLGDEDVIDKLINKELTIPSISADKEIKITFVKEIYTLRVTYTEGGTVRVSKNVGGYKEFASGQSAIFKTSDIVDVSINSKTGYRVKQVLLGNTDVTDKINNPGGREMLLTLSFSSSSLEEVKDQEVAVTFEKITYSVKVTYSNGGRAQVNGQSVASGNACSADIFTDVKVMMIPDKGYRLREVKLGFMDVMNQVNNNVLTIPSISENKEITIKFAYILKVYSSGSGSIKVNGEIIQSGSIVPDTGTKVEFIPNEGYYTAKVMLNSKDITSELVGNSFTVSTLPSYSSLSVTFKTLPTYKLSIDMPSNEASIKIGDRVITESTRISDIKEESSICINFQPSKYYKIKSVILEDKDITDQIQNDSYTIKSMKSNLTLKIEYIRKQYVLLIDIQGTDEIKFNGKDVTNGSSITTNSGYNRIDISSEYYLIKQVLLDNEIIKKGPSGYIEISMDSDKKLTIIAELREKREVSLTSEEPGTLASLLSEEDMKMVTDLNISGEIDQRDFLVLNQMQSLYKLNLIVTIREYNNYPANTIPENAFHNNKTIKMIDLSNSIEAIGKQAFWGSAISHINKYDENLTKIGEEAFKDCQYLTTIPPTYNVSVIEKSTFENCSSLSALPSLYNLIEVKESAFRNCKNLSVDLGSSLKRIGNYAFENVKEINTLPVFQGEAKLSYIGIDAFKGTQSNRFDFSNYPYLQELPNFEGSSNLNHITFPPNVKEVPANTFKGCTSLQEVYMNNKIERIAENAFCDSNGISYLYVPVNNTPEIFTNSFSEFCYINAALIVPTDYMYFYRHHAVWSKFTEIKHLGNDSHRQISATISEGGHVLSKAEEDMYPNNTFDTGSYNSISYPTSSRVEFIVEIDKGYSIESIILNGEDITNTLDNNNKFIIPNLMVDSHLEVKFKKEEDPTGTETIHINKHIYLSGSNQLVFSDFKIGTHAIVFDASGRMIKQITIRNNMERIDLPGRGIYFVRVENKSTKIIL